MLSREQLERMANWKLTDATQERLQWLMDRNTEGLLSDAEIAELESIVETSESLSLLCAEAWVKLGRRPPTGDCA